MANKNTYFITDLKGIFIAPGPTLGKLMGKKQWIISFLLICAVVFALSYVYAPAVIENLSQQLADQEIGGITKPTPLNRALVSISFLFRFLLRLTVGAFFLYLFFGIAGAKGVYANFFSVTVNAAIIGSLLPEILQFLLFLSNAKTTAVANATILFPSAAPGTWNHAILSQIDIFYLWFLFIVALGIASYAKIGKLKSILIALCYFIFRSAIVVLLSVLFAKLRGSIQI